MTDTKSAEDSLEERPQIPEVRHDLRILQSLRRIVRATELHSRDLASRYKITGPQLVCLYTLGQRSPLTVKEISEALYVSPSTVVGILDRLQKKEMIVRTRDPDDRRRMQVSITEKGKEIASVSPSPLQDRLFSALQSLPDLEQATIALSLERIVNLMEASELEGEPLVEAGPLAQTAESKERVLQEELEDDADAQI